MWFRPPRRSAICTFVAPERPADFRMNTTQPTLPTPGVRQIAPTHAPDQHKHQQNRRLTLKWHESGPSTWTVRRPPLATCAVRRLPGRECGPVNAESRRPDEAPDVHTYVEAPPEPEIGKLLSPARSLHGPRLYAEGLLTPDCQVPQYASWS
jgi:hypothetical protein